MKSFKSYLKKHPKFLATYLTVGTKTVDITLNTLKVFMHHLLVLQDVDPNEIPGKKLIKQFIDSMEQEHNKDYDSDFKFDWYKKAFNNVQKSYTNLNINQQTFNELTNLNSLKDPSEQKDSKKVAKKKSNKKKSSTTDDLRLKIAGKDKPKAKPVIRRAD